MLSRRCAKALIWGESGGLAVHLGCECMGNHRFALLAKPKDGDHSLGKREIVR